MGLFLRKALTTGPVRINLSKSGLGVSAGVKGARVGVGRQGPQVFAGRGGLYYRKKMGSSSNDSGSSSCLLIVLVAAIVAGFAIAIQWLADHPIVAAAIGLSIVAVLFAVFLIKRRHKNAVESYTNSLERCFGAENPITDESLEELRRLKSVLPSKGKWLDRIVKDEGDIYQGLLESALEDRTISDDEKTKIAQFESGTGIDRDTSVSIKAELFDSAYLNSIADRYITEEEFSHLQCFAEDLDLPKHLVSDKMSVVRDFKQAQELSSPLPSLDQGKTTIHITRNETLHHVTEGQVYTRRKNDKVPGGYEYSQKRSGELIVTSKRLCVQDSGKTNIKLADVEDIEVDIDSGFIFLDKKTSGRPSIVGCDHPICVGKILELAKQAG